MCAVFIDGGIRRGTDILKALCLGARAVGLGRPFLFAQSVSHIPQKMRLRERVTNFREQAYGEAGVIKLIRILEKEVVTGMRLLGATNVNELVPAMVSTSFVFSLFSAGCGFGGLARSSLWSFQRMYTDERILSGREGRFQSETITCARCYSGTGWIIIFKEILY